MSVSSNIQQLEITLSLLEAKLQSIESNGNASGTTSFQNALNFCLFGVFCVFFLFVRVPVLTYLASTTTTAAAPAPDGQAPPPATGGPPPPPGGPGAPGAPGGPPPPPGAPAEVRGTFFDYFLVACIVYTAQR